MSSGKRMRTFALLFVVCAVGPTLGAEPPARCAETATTQLALNQCAADSFRAAEKEMRSLIQRLRETHARDSLFLKRLDESQRAWLKYRTAQLAMRYPHVDSPRYYGSVLPMCEGDYLAQLTQQQRLVLAHPHRKVGRVATRRPPRGSR